MLGPISSHLNLRSFVEVTPAGGHPGGRTRQALARRIRPIRAIRKQEWDRLTVGDRYFRGRWAYTSVAARVADDLIERHRLRSALEVGPYRRPLVVGADVLDITYHDDLECEGRVVIHDATEAPWPFETGRYGLFVALQVFEHLRGRQHVAFSEVRRVARHAIISLPIDWEMDDPTNPHHRLRHEQALDWFAPVVPTHVEVGNPGPKKRLIYVFENLDRT
jgi:hypothetical protein